MKKLIIVALSAVLAVMAIEPAHAQDQKVLAIIDTAIDSNKFNSIVHEVCFTLDSCPNGTGYMEGPGSAAATGWLMQGTGVKAKKVSIISAWPSSINNGTYHGDSMVKSALATDPNLKIVFIRFADVTSLGNHRGDSQSLINAIDWVSKNASKYSIDAVSISQSGVYNDPKAKAKILHPACSDTATLSAVSQLSRINVPIFAATGNDGLSNLVGFPACVDGVIGVGAMASPTQLEKATNRGPGIDLVAFGKVLITKYNGSPVEISGSSGATAVAASSYVAKNTGKTFSDYINALTKVVVSGISYPYASK